MTLAEIRTTQCTTAMSARASCVVCNEIVPSQSVKPLIFTSEPEFPLNMKEIHFLTTVDRFSFWVNIYHLSHSATTAFFFTNLQGLFISYVVPEEIASDGDPQFISSEFQSFLKTGNPQQTLFNRVSSIQRTAELAVKTAKCIILDSTVRVSRDTDKVSRALL